jgi:site-specific DNA-cytosine methylase
MIYGSVCSGIEAATVAWHPLGWKPAWFSEIEPRPCAVLAHHYPTVPNLGDMTTIAARVRCGEVIAPDVLIGGTPCQSYSVAGLRQGLADERGQLTISFVKLADEIDHARTTAGKPAAIIVWENVPGVLSSKDNAFGCFLAGLAGEGSELQPPGPKWPHAGCVYGPTRTVAWRVLDAEHFGLAQQRARVIVIASARTGFDPASALFEFEGSRRDTAPSRGGQYEPADPTLPRLASGASATGCLTKSADEKHHLGNQEALKGHYHVIQYGLPRNFTAVEAERLQGFPDGYTAVGKLSEWARIGMLGNSMPVTVIRWLGERIVMALATPTAAANDNTNHAANAAA